MKVVANLPYEISSPMIFRLLEHREHFSLFVLMFQLEVARKIVSQPGEKDYGPLSIWTHLYCRSRIMFRVPPGAFFPPPKVDSAVVKFEVLENPRLPVEDKRSLERVIRSAFTYRRKTIANALKLGAFKSLPLPEILASLQAAHIDPKIRGERLSLEQFNSLSQELSAHF
jgi:16S rRNA (adenine1518-N6/adenine1519-N6)-dimethyltransferase